MGEAARRKKAGTMPVKDEATALQRGAMRVAAKQRVAAPGPGAMLLSALVKRQAVRRKG